MASAESDRDAPALLSVIGCLTYTFAGSDAVHATACDGILYRSIPTKPGQNLSLGFDDLILQRTNEVLMKVQPLNLLADYG